MEGFDPEAAHGSPSDGKEWQFRLLAEVNWR
jgi:hypothetical protein